jgi:hypothetical protein
MIEGGRCSTSSRDGKDPDLASGSRGHVAVSFSSFSGSIAINGSSAVNGPFLADRRFGRRLGLFEPHEEHWSTVPI